MRSSPGSSPSSGGSLPGTLLFLDPLRNDGRALSRWLWRYDRGRHPRTLASCADASKDASSSASREEFAIYHQYVLWVASPL